MLEIIDEFHKKKGLENLHRFQKQHGFKGR
jgi:hypothetical protein